MAEPEEQTKPVFTLKHDWYQTEVAVVITILAKNIKQEDLSIEFTETSVKLRLKLPDSETQELEFKLSHKIVPEQSGYKTTPSKIEIKLKKLEGIRWQKLEASVASEIAAGISQAEASRPPSYPTSKKGRDWSAIERDIKREEASEKPEGEEALNNLFQEIYGKGSDEVKKAMNKSYLESGGTVLSTNWGEISRQKVDVKPPDGMEWKKWDS